MFQSERLYPVSDPEYNELYLNTINKKGTRWDSNLGPHALQSGQLNSRPPRLVTGVQDMAYKIHRKICLSYS